MAEPLAGRTVVLGITGSIAAYKGAEVARRLMELGAEVHATLTRGGAQFISPTTLRSLTGNPVTVDMFADPQEWQVKHVSLARRAAAVVVAPASANAIAKLALGLADEFIYAVALATRAPLVVAPAMNDWMYQHPATRQNLETLRTRGAAIVEPETGRLASGAIGQGRLAAPEAIAAAVVAAAVPGDLRGVRVLVTAGPTREPLDAVRYISNRSSGRMGYALAAAAAARGASVVLVTGPTALSAPADCEVVAVTTAQEMRDKVAARLDKCDVLIAAAAVADYAPEQVSRGKMKKSGESLTVTLAPTPDILAECGARKRPGQLLVGFAAETEDVLANARAKLKAKNLDLIVANDVSRPGIGFDAADNAGWLLYADGREVEIPRTSKAELAAKVLDAVVELRRGREGCAGG